MQALADQLKDARIAAGLTLPELQARTKIRYRYLEAMERGAFFEIPGEVYAKAFLRAYAREVGLDPEQVVQEFQRWYQQQPLPQRSRPGWRPLGVQAMRRQRPGRTTPMLGRSRPAQGSGSHRLVAVSLALLLLGMAVAAASLWRSGVPALFPRWEERSSTRTAPAVEERLWGWIQQEDAAAGEGRLSPAEPSAGFLPRRVDVPASVTFSPGVE